MTTNRNELCLCGSNKKFKKCCLPLHLKRERWDPLEDDLRFMIEEFFDSERFLEDRLNAMSLYGTTDEDLDDVGRQTLFLDWFIHEYVVPSENDTIIRIFLKERGGELGRLEKETVRSWSESIFSFYEITCITRGTGFTVKEIFGREEFFIFDVSGSLTLHKYDLIFVRVHKIGDIAKLSGGGKTLSPYKAGDVRKFVEHGLKSSGMDDVRSYLSKHSLDILKYIDTLFVPPTLVTSEGDMLVMSGAEYRVTSTKKVLNILKSSEQFVYDGMEKKVWYFAWVANTRDNPHDALSKIPDGMAVTSQMHNNGKSVSVLGTLSIKSGSLLIECMSEQRLEQGKKVVEDLLPGLVTHVTDTYKEPFVEDAAGDDTDEQDSSLSYEDLTPQGRKSLEKYFEDYYQKWLDTRIPALDSMTPLEASRTQQGRILLEDLMKGMENTRERDGRNNSLAYPVEMLRKKLGLDNCLSV